MSSRRVVYSLLIGAVVAAAGVALAQEGVGASAEGDGGGRSEVDVERRADLSGPEQVAEAQRVQQRGTQISRRVQTMLDEARREHDIIRVTCLNDKLTQVDANLRTLERRLGSLSEAVQGQDSGRRNHEFTVVTVLGQKFVVLEQEANQCLGQDLFETGSTRVTTTIEPTTPDEDPTEMPEPEHVNVPFIPPPASGAM